MECLNVAGLYTRWSNNNDANWSIRKYIYISQKSVILRNVILRAESILNVYAHVH